LIDCISGLYPIVVLGILKLRDSLRWVPASSDKEGTCRLHELWESLIVI
jgi:hypothetical protein